MKEEMRAFEKNETWEMVVHLKEKKKVGCKWVYTIKFKAKGTIEQYKTRLIAKGYTQTYEVDYQETFCIGGKNEYGENPIISNSSFWLGNPTM